MRAWRLAYVVAGWLFFAAVLVQIFLAGMGTFVDSEHWGTHTTFAHFFELLPLVMFGVSFPAQLQGALRWLPLAALALISLQYATAAGSPGILAALHPVIAVLIAGLAYHMARSATSLAKSEPATL